MEWRKLLCIVHLFGICYLSWAVHRCVVLRITEKIFALFDIKILDIKTRRQIHKIFLLRCGQAKARSLAVEEVQHSFPA